MIQPGMLAVAGAVSGGPDRSDIHDRLSGGWWRSYRVAAWPVVRPGLAVVP